MSKLEVCTCFVLHVLWNDCIKIATYSAVGMLSILIALSALISWERLTVANSALDLKSPKFRSTELVIICYAAGQASYTPLFTFQSIEANYTEIALLSFLCLPSILS